MSEQKAFTWLEHLEELRRVILISLVALLIATFGCYFYNDFFLGILTRPVHDLGLKLVFIGVAEGFFTQIQVALYAGFVVSFPIIIWQIWRFIVPALYPHEKRYVLVLVPVSVLLFIGGVLFAYTTVFPIMLRFLLQVSGDLEPMITISQYVSFCVTFLLPFGIMFELPVFSMFLTRIGILTPEWLIKNRKYALLVCFVVGAVLTPSPDPLSQILMAGPMYILYEVSILVSRVFRKKKAEDDDQEKVENEDQE